MCVHSLLMQQIKMEANADKKVTDDQYLPRQTEDVPSIRGRNMMMEREKQLMTTKLSSDTVYWQY